MKTLPSNWISEGILDWWIVWNVFPNGTAVPQAAFPFHAMAKDFSLQLANPVICVVKNGAPPSKNYTPSGTL